MCLYQILQILSLIDAVFPLPSFELAERLQPYIPYYFPRYSMMMFIDVSLTGYYFPCVVLKWKVSFLIKVLAYHVYTPMKYH